MNLKYYQCDILGPGFLDKSHICCRMGEKFREERHVHCVGLQGDSHQVL